MSTVKTKKKVINNRRSRKYQITINNPEKHKNCSHQAIKEKLKQWEHITYWCMCDGTAEENRSYILERRKMEGYGKKGDQSERYL